MHVYRYLGDFSHAVSLLLFLVIVGIKGNGSGVSLKSHYLYLIVFLTRYLDVVTTFYNWYNTLMKIFFFASTISIIFILTKKEPAKSTYSPTLDSVNHLNLVIAAALTGMVVHLVGSGVVDIKGSSGQEFEVHLEHYSWLSFLWTFSVCLEPLAMIPQLYIFRKHRLINRDIRCAILFMGLYRFSYVIFWVFRAYKVEEFRHHFLLYITGIFQCLTYADFFLYHWSVLTLWFLTKYGGFTGDSSSMLADSGIESWALQASGRYVDEAHQDDEVVDFLLQEEGWQPGNKPASKTIQMKKMKGSGLGVVL